MIQMQIMRLSIKLLSDMCCATGEGNGSSVNTYTAFDDIGIPYIPAKRIKGLLREQAEFLFRYQYDGADAVTIGKLFGNVNGLNGVLRVDNAFIIGYEQLHEELSNEIYNNALRKAEITDAYCSLRTQTKIDADGIAAHGSLRTMQVVNQKLGGDPISFECELRITNPDEKMIVLLQDCVKTLRHIGMNKTRGYGEVECVIEKGGVKENTIDAFLNKEKSKIYEYSITLLDDVVISAGSNIRQDYISGNMVQGAFARYVKGFDGFVDVFLKRVVFSNAYIDGMNPIPLSYRSEKNESKTCYSFSDEYEKDDDKHYVSVNGYYRIEGDKFHKRTVDMATEYHYSTKTEDVFTYRKIIKAQTFKGTVSAPAGVIDVLKTALSDRDGMLLVGGSASAQYARCKFEILNEVLPKNVQIEDTMVVELLTDVVVRDEYRAISDNTDDLTRAFSKLFVFDSENVEVFSETITGGGFNAKWKLPIQQYTAFVKGSVLVIKDCKPPKSDACESIPETGFMRDISFGGYGQYRIRPLSGKKEYDVVNDVDGYKPSLNSNLSESTRKIMGKIMGKIISNRICAEAEKKAIIAAPKNDRTLPQSPAMRTYSLFKTNRTRDSFARAVNNNFGEEQNKKKKIRNKELYEFATKLIVSYDDFVKETIEFYNNLNVTYSDDIFNMDDMFNEYARAYLFQVKRNYQQERGGAQA